ncbi:MAG: glyoxylate/hydroxypyruvate reductase A [Pseudorhodobacter sp.]
MSSQKSAVLLAVHFEGERQQESFPQAFTDRKVIDLNDGSDHPGVFHGVKYAVVWKPSAELFSRLPDLEVIFSAGAGVDHILQQPHLPDLPVVRFVDETLTTRMSEWVCLQCLMHLRQQRKYDTAQKQRVWFGHPQPEAKEITVGIMGMGVLGQDAARKLKTLGFNVIGWSRTPKQIDGVMCYDASGLDVFLEQTHFLVGLLPFTKDTAGIFHRGLFKKLKRHDEIASPILINAGRGGSQIEDDIIAALEDGTLGGVSLDVFESEPLSTNSKLWGFEQAIITPHIAANSDVTAIGYHVHRQIERYERGDALEHLVDQSKGY